MGEMVIDFQAAASKLASVHQEHVLKFWSTLTYGQQKRLLEQIQNLDLQKFKQQREAWQDRSQAQEVTCSPFLDHTTSGNDADYKKGQQLIAEGHVGCLLIAGGQGSRLKFDGPKGVLPVTLIAHKSLFQLCAEKVLAAGHRAGRALPLAIMTSPLNEAETRNYFFENKFFGLKSEQVTFFSQGMLPLLDTQGNLFLETPDTIAQGPDGNGSSLAHFVASGIWEQWDRAGIRHLMYILIDNALSDPFDAELVGFHVRKSDQVTLKCTARIDPNENMGIVVKKQGHVEVIEYSELPMEEKSATLSNGMLKHLCANLSIFCFDMDFIKYVTTNYTMPLHMAFKAVRALSPEGKSIKPSSPNAWKTEFFIFDVLPAASRVSALLFPREQCFAALKNAEGPDSLPIVQKALQKRDREILEQISGIKSPDVPFELSPFFYYPTSELINTWKGRMLPHGGYIKPLP